MLYIDGEVAAQDVKNRTIALGASDNLIYINHELLFDRAHLTLDIANAEWQDAILTLCDRHDRLVALLIDGKERLLWA